MWMSRPGWVVHKRAFVMLLPLVGQFRGPPLPTLNSLLPIPEEPSPFPKAHYIGAAHDEVSFHSALPCRRLYCPETMPGQSSLNACNSWRVNPSSSK